ncbi:WD40 containing snare-dependent exocytosis protein [Lentinula aciculospora]|uniref:WD40 containing snare-dependent exocytosis protein n=1 Tax=Lentinula aciculospora TaxID=153920 RepID=A0A9W9AMA5_9AGAR|nr:WD40 containing snare-dependent exocytosis protein [Lentinula aciculospora]
MFSKHHESFIDLSLDLHEPQDWKPGVLRTLEYASKVTALAYEPIAGLLAVGTPGSIELLGKPGVACKITLPDLHEVKILHISSSTFKLLCLDEHNKLHIWDLSTYGQPKLLTTVRFDQSNSVTISPSHSHAFIAQQTGEIKTYDLECLRKSSYNIPNMWTLYEEKMAASGMPEIATPTSGIAIDTVIHPRDLNLLFVVYGGGVVLSDLSERKTLRTYELVYPPGAPGGTGYRSSDILTHRRPEATCMAVHPAGHFFAVGYADGSIAFWAIEDEDQPLLVRTLDDLDVSNIDADQLEAHLAPKGETAAASEKEPIFKLSWCSFPNSSDPRGGETALVILGGLNSEDSSGITVQWLPAFNPTDPLATQSVAPSLHPHIRSSMRSSVEPLDSYFYQVNGIVHDYVLIPREEPHLSGSFDVISILVVRESIAGMRVVEAYEFPPPAVVQHAYDDPHLDTEVEEGTDTLDDLASTLQDLQSNVEPRRVELPGYLSNGTSGLLGGVIRTMTKDAYSSLVQTDALRYSLCLKAGFAWLDPIDHISKYQPPRIAITWHADFSVQVWDVSAQLLHKFKPDPIESDFPNPLPNLTLDTNIILTAASVAPKLSSRDLSIKFVKIAPESLECAVVFSSGLIIVYRFVSPPDSVTPFEELVDPELLSLTHLPPSLNSRFSPYFAFLPNRGQVSACALADVGFFAVTYTDGTLFVVDMRGPAIILRHGIKTKNRHSIGVHMDPDTDPITCLEWTISPIDKDERLALRLVVGHDSGTFQVFTFGRSMNSSWAPVKEVAKFDGPDHPIDMFVINSKNGSRCLANRSRLAAALNDSETTRGTVPVLFVTAGLKGARCNMNISGDRIGKVEWSHKMGKVLSVQIVQKLSSYALVAFTENHEACAYSLPTLEFLHNMALPPVTYLPKTVDETGDFIAWTRNPETGLIRQATYGTLFNFRRVDTPPAVDFLSTKPMVPAQPQPVSVGPPSILGSWFNFGQSMTGAQVDVLLGGPDRPVPIQKSKLQPPDTSAREIAKQATATQSSLYDRLTAAVNERGQMLGDLEDRFNSLESGSRSMVDQAKKLAAEQSAKSWFKF